MRFSLALLFTFLAAFVFANPILQRDTNDQVKSLLDGLESTITPLTHKITAALSDSSFDPNNEDSVKSLQPTIDAIAAAFNATGLALGKLGDGSVVSRLVRRQSPADIALANQLVAIINQVIAALQPLLNFLQTIPLIELLLGGTLASLGASLDVIVFGLGIVIAGVLNLVRQLLTDLTGALSLLGAVGILTGIFDRIKALFGL